MGDVTVTLDEQGHPAVWDVVDPSCTVFNPARETFANVWAPYDEDFSAFHDHVASLMAEHREAETPFPQGFPPPANLFDISSLPWTFFTGFTLHVENGWDHVSPVFTLGKHEERAGRRIMPVALQIHHCAADGFHAAQLLDDLEQLMTTPDWVHR